jgi:mRNA interferase MazF
LAIQFHPQIGTIVVCDYRGLEEPEMVKRRLSIVVSDGYDFAHGICIVVPLSTTEPAEIKPYHYRIAWDTPFPAPYNSNFHWVKGDMIYTMGFERLFLPFDRKDGGKRQYDIRQLPGHKLKEVQKCILHGMSLSCLTEHL